MFKKIFALTLAGFLALPFISGGHAEAAGKIKTDAFKISVTDLLKKQVQTDNQKIPDVNELLKQLGINPDLTQLSNNPTVVTVPKKENSKPCDKPKQQSDQDQTAQPQKPEQQPAQPEKPSGDSGDKEQQPSTEQPSDNQMNAFEKKVVELTNAERTKAGLNPLKSDNATLAKMARAKSQDMSDKNYFDHQSPTYGSPFDMMKKYGISYRTAGENIAAGQKTPEEVVQGWMNSPGHRANILNGDFTTIGVGYVEGGSYGSYWTQEFIGE